ncbi:MAG: cob(I)yrinic acid a,c-diamide adenosyltransferase [Sumerlaeia bacterium]
MKTSFLESQLSMANEQLKQEDAEFERTTYRITKVYTKTGDRGETGLVGGQRVAKYNLRIESYGTVDELTSTLGVARLENKADQNRYQNPADVELVEWHLDFIQHQLFVLGGDLATRVEDRHPLMPVIREEHVDYMERLIDAFNQDLPPLKDFILPGGSRTAAQLHICRTVSRRAERLVCHLAAEEEVDVQALIYLNRLSDALFVLARWVNLKMGVRETTWNRKLIEPPLPSIHEK